MHKLHELKNSLLTELNAYGGRNAFTTTDIETIRNLISSILKICEYTKMEDSEDYSNRMSNRGSYDYYEDGGDASYARGRMRAKRDAMGRYSRGYGYSRNDEMMSKLYEVMNEAPEEHKMEIKKMIERLEQM